MRPREGNKLVPTDDYRSVGEVVEKVCSPLRPKPAPGRVASLKARGAVLAEDVVSESDVPDRPRSHMDGYAVRGEDLTGATEESPVELTVKGEIGPRRDSKISIGPGEAARVATGAPMPRGSDTVIPVERTREGGGVVTIAFPAERGTFVFPKGSDCQRGEVVLHEGQVVRAQDVGLLLTLGIESVKVYRKPRVSVLATGSELTDEEPGRGTIRNTHSPVFLNLLQELGCDAIDEGVARDDQSVIARKIRKALKESDFVVTLGGTSVGRRDVVGEAVSSLKPDPYFHGVKLDRGRVSGMALVRGKPILMLPGPVQGAMNAFLAFGAPAARVLSGRKAGFRRVSCVFDGEWRAREKFSAFTKVVYVALTDHGRKARPLFGETESIGVLAKAEGFLVIPEGVTSLSKGDRVDVNLLPGSSFY